MLAKTGSPTASRKRAISQRDLDEPSTTEDGAESSPGAAASTTNFRNVSACNRCRNRKNRCDQKLPRCSGCDKANVNCLGFDPLTKRAIPRSYIYYLETRVVSLEHLLGQNGIACPPPSNDFPINPNIRPGENVPFPIQEDDVKAIRASNERPAKASAVDPSLKNDSGTGSVDFVKGSKDVHAGHAGSTIPFSAVVYAAVKSTVSQTPSERASSKPSRQMSSATASGGGTSQSFFSLHSRPTGKAAPFPEKSVGYGLVELYFEHANPQIPILHRPEYMELFDRVYEKDPVKRTPREQYLLNIVFAIGAGTIVESTSSDSVDSATDTGSEMSDPPNRKRQRLSKDRQYQPEEYHAAAIVHLESFLSSSPAAEGVGGGLEELQAVLLLAGLALLRPIAPGLWYIIGLAMRLATDLGLHLEDVDESSDSQALYSDPNRTPNTSAGRRQWTRDLRRRLWWCVYSFDRLVSTCVGRPCTVPEDLITTPFPSMLPDDCITTSGFKKAPNEFELPSYKLVARHYFELRLLQSEILRVIQHRHSERAYELGKSHSHNTGTYNAMRSICSGLPSPFTHNFDSFRDWRADVDSRLLKWKESAPTEEQIGVRFTPLFLELNYWQAVLLLYRQSLEVPEPLGGETSLSPSTGDVHSPGGVGREDQQDDHIAMKVAQAGQTVLKIYKELHFEKLVNYTFLATHHIFMSGISFLSAIWHSKLVRAHLTFDDVEFTVFVATSVLRSLASKCPPAESCHTALVRASQATVAKVGRRSFGRASTLAMQPLSSPGGYFTDRDDLSRSGNSSAPTNAASATKPRPIFDQDLSTLFSEDELAHRPLTSRPKLQQYDSTGPSTLPVQSTFGLPSSVQAEAPVYPSPDQQSGSGASQYTQAGPPQQVADVQGYNALSETMSQPSMELDLDTLSWLNGFTSNDPDHNLLPTGNELDFGFGTGNAIGYDQGGDNWDMAGNVDLSGGLFFGNNANGYQSWGG